MNWEVGQGVLVVTPLSRGGGRSRRAKISRVGRKYVYVMDEWGRREMVFHASTGLEKDVYHRPARLFTDESLAIHEERQAAYDRLQEHIRRNPYSWTDGLSAQDMNQISDVIEAAREARKRGE